MLKYHVADMTCSHCERAIRNEIADLDSQAVVQVNLEQKLVQVESSQTPEAIQAAIAEAGYQVELRS